MTERSTVADSSQVRASSDRTTLAESSLSTAAEGDFTSLVTNPPTSDNGVTSTKLTREPLCPECQQLDQTGITVAMVLGGDLPRWDRDRNVLRKGWLDGRCGLCGLTVPASSAAASVDEVLISSLDHHGVSASPSTGEQQ
jgi:hypothetical protein